MGEKEGSMSSDKVQRQELRAQASKLSKAIDGLSPELLLSEGLDRVEEYALLIDEILKLGLDSESREDLNQLVSAHIGVIQALDRCSDHLSGQQRDLMQKMRGILRYLDSLPARVSLIGSKKG